MLVQISRGFSAQIDDADACLVSPIEWLAKGKPGYVYARAADGSTSMHRLIMGLPRGDKRVVDHINGNTLDNRRCNLRVCTQSQNMRNTEAVRGAVRFKGVSIKRNAANPFQARITVEGKLIHLGLHATAEAAAAAYNDAARKYHGEFASLNQI